MKHKHAELIKAWADGAEIERWINQDYEWKNDSLYPTWDERDIYRIKPKKPEVQLDHHIMTMNLRFTIEKDGALMKFVDVELIK